MRETSTHIYFYKEYLSQWYKRPFTDGDGITYNCAEQYMMYKKAILFRDYNTADNIIKNIDPRKQKELGREIQNFSESIWKSFRLQIVTQGNYLKFSTNEDLRNKLINTGSKILVEASKVDRIWGVGLAENDDRILEEILWNGLNLLGQALMAARIKIIDDVRFI